MRVAVEEAVAEELVEARLHHVPRELLAVHARRLRVFEHGVELHALELLQRDHRPAGKLAIQPRDDHVGPLRVVARELLDVARLVLEVQLQEHGGAELGDDAGGRVDAGLLDHAFEEAGEVEEQVGVAADLLLDAGPLHLHHHVVARGESGAVHLGDGGAGHRLGIDEGEELLRGPAQSLFDELEDERDRHGSGAVLQLRQLGDEVRRKDVGPRGEDLAELDEGGPQLRQGVAKSPGGGGARGFSDGRLVLAPSEHVPDAGAVPELAEAVAYDHRADLAQAAQILDGLNHGPASLTARRADPPSRARCRRGSRPPRKAFPAPRRDRGGRAGA